MSKMSGPKRKKVYELLARRDGERCFIGCEPGTFDDLIVDHWDGNDGNNRPSNLHLLCRPMNAVKNPRGKAVLRETKDGTELLSSMRVRRIQTDGIIRPLMVKAQSAEFLKNMNSKPDFRHLLFYCIVYVSQLDYSEVVRNAAELVDCSQDTIKRYLDRMTCAAGLYQLTKSEETGKMIIRLKPRWENFRKTNSKKAILSEQANNWKDKPTHGYPLGKIISL